MATIINAKAVTEAAAELEQATIKDIHVFVNVANIIKSGADQVQTLSKAYSRELFRVIAGETAGAASAFLSAVKKQAKHGSIPRMLAAVNRLAAAHGKGFVLPLYETIKAAEGAAEAAGAVSDDSAAPGPESPANGANDGEGDSDAQILADAAAQDRVEVAMLEAIVAEASRIFGIADYAALLAEMKITDAA